MREIKFRAFIKKTKEMIDIIGFIKENNQYRIWWKDKKTDLIVNVSYHESMVEILQYVGEKDINKKEICEGDITLKLYRTRLCSDKSKTKNLKCTIEYVDHSFTFNTKDPERYKYGYCSGWWDDMEVIGNIYENPELLEKV